MREVPARDGSQTSRTEIVRRVASLRACDEPCGAPFVRTRGFYELCEPLSDNVNAPEPKS
jgi:hypothetical protein